MLDNENQSELSDEQIMDLVNQDLAKMTSASVAVEQEPNTASEEVEPQVVIDEPAEAAILVEQESEELGVEDDSEAQDSEAQEFEAQEFEPEMETIEVTPNAQETIPPAKSKNEFAELGLSDKVVASVQKAGYETPTPIQAEIIPVLMQGQDIIAQSQTGTGKTAAFALPILSKVGGRSKKGPQVLVLVPTRELAIQVAKSFSTYSKCLDDVSVAAIYGGQDYEPQLKQLRRGVQVVVGTPGRVIDHIKRETLNLGRLRTVVLDEADEMLNMGFLEDVEFVLEKSPEYCQVALFSATLPKPIRRIADKYLEEPAKVTIKKKTMTADSIRQRATFVSPRNKVDMLIRFLEAEPTDGVIVFTRTRESTSVVAEKLCKSGFSAVALSGEVAQKTRERTIERFKAGSFNILVATDVAARGLDVNRISHVFNFDLPEGPEAYIHRVGRTGRAGRKGEALIFLTKSQRGKLKWIERETKQPIEIVEPPSLEQINSNRIQRFKDEIVSTIESQDLQFYQTLLKELAEESGSSFEDIAAAIAHLKKHGKHFLMKKEAKSESRGRKGDKRFEKGFHTPEQGMVRYRLAVGKRDGIRVGSIVGAVANEGGIEGDRIGPIKMHQSYTTIDLPEGMPDDVFETLKETRIAGRALRISPAREFDGGKRKKGRGRSNASNSQKFRGKSDHGSGFGKGRGKGKGKKRFDSKGKKRRAHS